MSKLGIALGGGGARGLAHIGVLKVLEKEKIEIYAITGCSMGSVIGSLYAFYKNAEKIEELMLNFIKNINLSELGIPEDQTKQDLSFWDSFVTEIKFRYNVLRSLKGLSLLNEEHIDKIFSIIPDINFSELKINFSAIATDLISGKEFNIKSGNLRSAVRASSAIPGIFPPVRINNNYFVDGSASESVPARKVRELGGDRVLAVDVSHCLKTEEEPKNVLEILFRTEDITSFHLSQERLKEADLIISPNVRELTWAEFSKAEEIIAEGEKSAEKMLPEIEKLINRYSLTLELEQLLKKFRD